MIKPGDEIHVAMDGGRTITVTADNAAECRSCGEPIVWCVTSRGKKMPVDLPDEETNEPTTSHFATCADADQWRKK